MVGACCMSAITPIGKMYKYDKINSLMHQSQCTDVADMPAAIDKSEKELRTCKDRTGADFPEVLNMPILLQMMPPSYRREFEAQLGISYAHRSYEV